jgi:glycosyltransferase involved in cell wall biosynthesis
MKEISICMITYNKSPFLLRSIPAIWNSITHNGRVEFLVLDNGSSDDTSDVLKSLSVKYPISVAHIDDNVGLNGYGILTRYASGDMIITADDDIFFVSRGWEDLFVRSLAVEYNGRKFGYVGSHPINAEGGRMNEVWADVHLGDLHIEIAPTGGWFTMTTADVMKMVGGFHTGQPKMYLEDADYQSRVWAYGLACGILMNVQVHHACSPQWYTDLDRVSTYNAKVKLAREVGINLETIA